jgi:Tfp pilus assembly PilM family ATPase
MAALFRRKDSESIGIHVGSDRMTVLRAARQQNLVRVVQMASERLLRRPGEWPAGAVADFLRRARRAVKFKVRSVGMGLASDLAATTVLDMGGRDGPMLAEAVSQRLQEQHRGASAQLTFDFEVTERFQERCHVWAVSMPLPMLKLILATAREAPLKVDAVLGQSVALARLLEFSGLFGRAPVAALCLGKLWSGLHIFKDRKVAFSRILAPTDLREQDDPSAGTASAGSEEGSEAEALSGPAYAPGWLVSEVGKCLDYFEIELLSEAVERVFLVGEGARAEEVRETLIHDLSVDVAPMELGERVEDRTGEFDGSRHALALAAALHEEVANERQSHSA